MLRDLCTQLGFSVVILQFDPNRVVISASFLSAERPLLFPVLSNNRNRVPSRPSRDEAPRYHIAHTKRQQAGTFPGSVGVWSKCRLIELLAWLQRDLARSDRAQKRVEPSHSGDIYEEVAQTPIELAAFPTGLCIRGGPRRWPN